MGRCRKCICFCYSYIFFYEFTAHDYEILRDQVCLLDILGNGQFGDVHKGIYREKDGNEIPVAVKTCKEDNEASMTEKFLEEASKKLNHVPEVSYILEVEK